jgi:hypothetical protein
MYTGLLLHGIHGTFVVVSHLLVTGGEHGSENARHRDRCIL